MLDLSMLTTEECVYPKCEGGLIVLRHNGVWRAKRSLSVRFLHVRRRAAHVDDFAARGFRTVWRDAVVSMTPSQTRRPSQMTMKRCGSAHGVGIRPRRGAGFTSIQ